MKKTGNEGIDLFSYRGSPGFQKHSATSRAAAKRGNGFSKQAGYVLDMIRAQGSYGAITDEIRKSLLASGHIHENSVMSARVRELEMAGLIVKTTSLRQTGAGGWANVYVTHEIFLSSCGYLKKDVTKPAKSQRPKAKYYTFDEYHEDFGDVLWFCVPVDEPPFSGSPHDSNWPYDESAEKHLRWCILPEPPVK